MADLIDGLVAVQFEKIPGTTAEFEAWYQAKGGHPYRKGAYIPGVPDRVLPGNLLLYIDGMPVCDVEPQDVLPPLGDACYDFCQMCGPAVKHGWDLETPDWMSSQDDANAKSTNPLLDGGMR